MPPREARVLTLEKGLKILAAVSERGRTGVTLTELAEALEVSKSTVHRFLATLEDTGYLERDESTERYRVGIKVLKLAGAFLDGQGVRHVASPYLHDLMLRTGETSHLCVLDGREVIYVDKVDSPHPLRMYSYVGLRLPVHSTAAGKAILAHLAEARLQSVLSHELPARTPRTITSAAAFRQHLLDVRSRGYAVDDEEEVEGVRCVAVPIFDFEGCIAGAVSLSAPAGRLSLGQAHDVATFVKEAADQISRRLGFTLRVPVAAER